jgi:hypothetical protein
MNTTETLTELTARVANAMEAAMIEYGPDAVNLALLAYQVEAIRYLGFGFIGLALALGVAAGYAKLWKISAAFESEADRDGSRFACGTIVFFIMLFPLSMIENLLSPAHWIAAFGSPELLIATKALQAAGAL